MMTAICLPIELYSRSIYKITLVAIYGQGAEEPSEETQGVIIDRKVDRTLCCSYIVRLR